MTPGPVEMPKYVLKILAEPMIHHRTEEFESTLDFCLHEIKKIFKTNGKVFFQTSTGSGGLESSLVNTLTPGDKVIAINGGKFGERWADMARNLGYNVVEHKVKWGQCFVVDEISELIKKHPETKAILVQACETSTGVMNPLEDLGAQLKKSDILLLVDAITALGCSDLDMDGWGLDVVVGGSQKAFMLPTGMSITAYSEKAWAFVQKSKTPKYYWDIKAEHKSNQKKQTLFSSPVAHIRCLKAVLEHIAEIGVETFIHKHKDLSKRARELAQPLGFEVFAQTPAWALTALKVPHGYDGEEIQLYMENEHHITIAGGQDFLKGKIIRIGHMGAIGSKETNLTFEKLAQTLRYLKK